MKNAIILLISYWLCTLTAFAQGEEDFAASYMRHNAKDHKLECITVSPEMMGRIYLLPSDSLQQDSLQQVLHQVKSIRIVNSTADPSTIEILYEKAELLASYSKLCYEVFAKDSDCTIYVRRFDDIIVELVMLLRGEEEFCIVDFTGNMNEDLIRLMGNAPAATPQNNAAEQHSTRTLK